MSIVIKRKESTEDTELDKQIKEKLELAGQLAKGLKQDFGNLRQTLLDEKAKLIEENSLIL